MSAEGCFQVVYLTGSPATGKSTVLSRVEKLVSPLITFSYSRALADHISRRDGASYTQDDMRLRSAQLISPQDVKEVDGHLMTLVRENRARSHILIDSHAVTKETYGFRVTAFSIGQLEALNPTMIFVLYTEPSVAAKRIAAHPQGRPIPSIFDASYHSDLQGAVAIVYGIHLGVPIYFLDASRSPDEVAHDVMKRMDRSRTAEP